jgi:sarcosine oxidase/L-pipecolate oxidase
MITQQALRLGVKSISDADGTMANLYVSDGKLTGIKVASRRTHTATQYILCTGAASPGLFPELSTQLWLKC